MFFYRVSFVPDETQPTHMVFHWSNRSHKMDMNVKLPEGGKEVADLASQKENFALSLKRFDKTMKYYLQNYELPFIPHWVDRVTGIVTHFDNPGAKDMPKGVQNVLQRLRESYGSNVTPKDRDKVRGWLEVSLAAHGLKTLELPRIVESRAHKVLLSGGDKTVADYAKAVDDGVLAASTDLNAFCAAGAGSEAASNSTDTTYKCPTCDLTFDSLDKVANHRVKDHPHMAVDDHFAGQDHSYLCIFNGPCQKKKVSPKHLKK